MNANHRLGITASVLSEINDWNSKACASDEWNESAEGKQWRGDATALRRAERVLKERPPLLAVKDDENNFAGLRSTKERLDALALREVLYVISSMEEPMLADEIAIYAHSTAPEGVTMRRLKAVTYSVQCMFPKAVLLEYPKIRKPRK